ncbi:MAG: alpha/beta hydrolase [Rhodospirillales bacterium]|jgi:hypothetical protein|nr:alpha/beta hydrolase [Rhodospirillales bacterium]
MTNLIATVTGVYIFFVAALFVFQRNLLYHPDSMIPSPVASGVAEMDAVSLITDDGLRLLAWYRPAKAGKATVVYFHGNAGNIGNRGDKIRPYLDSGLGVLLVSYRGYAGNPGSPTEDGLYADGRAALDFLVEHGAQPADAVLYGESLGSGIAVELAHRRAASEPVAAVVLEAPFSTLADVAQTHYPFVPARWMVKDRFDSMAKIAAIGAPLLIIHGGRDRVVPIRFGRRLFAAAAQPKEHRWLDAAGHNDLYSYGTATVVIAYIERLWSERAADRRR